MPLPGRPNDRDDVSDLVSGRARSKRSLLMILLVVAAVVVARQTGLFGPVVDTQSLASADSAALIAQLQAAGPLLVEGDPAGDVDLIEFFDYRCAHCRRMAPVVQDLLDGDPGVRLILVEFPVLGPESELAARFALAAARQDAYETYHRALMFSTVAWTSDALTDLGVSLGLDGDKLRQDSSSAEISSLLAAYKSIGKAANVDGTPAFVAGSLMIIGAADALTLVEMIKQARQDPSVAP
jgi:protein-disulfide isomerase